MIVSVLLFPLLLQSAAKDTRHVTHQPPAVASDSKEIENRTTIATTTTKTTIDDHADCSTFACADHGRPKRRDSSGIKCLPTGCTPGQCCLPTTATTTTVTKTKVDKVYLCKDGVATWTKKAAKLVDTRDSSAHGFGLKAVVKAGDVLSEAERKHLQEGWDKAVAKGAHFEFHNYWDELKKQGMIACKVPNCASYTCPADMSLRLQPERISCDEGGCTAYDCCLLPTNKLVQNTCASYQCKAPATLRAEPDRLRCNAERGCDEAVCCELPASSTPVQPSMGFYDSTGVTCAGYPCKAPATLRLQPDLLTCMASGCTEEDCCLLPAMTAPVPPATGVTCAGYPCKAPATLRLQPDLLPCMASGCTEEDCCLLPATSTPAQPLRVETCAGYPCKAPATLRLQPDLSTCMASGCTEEDCCLLPATSSPALPSTVKTCAGYPCKAPAALRFQPDRLTCSTSGCNEEYCCLLPATSPQAPPYAGETCEGFSCPEPMVLQEEPGKLVCANLVGGCSASRCCTLGAKFSAKHSAEGEVGFFKQAWLMPACAMFASIAMVAGVGFTIHRSSFRSPSNARAYASVRPVDEEEEDIFNIGME